MPTLLALSFAACSDYDVAHSKLVADAESEEILLAEGASAEVLLLLGIDAEALAGNPNDQVDVSVFAVMAGDTPPTVVASVGSETMRQQVTAPDFLETSVTNTLVGCGGETPVFPTSENADGSCSVEIPVTLATQGGSAELQVAAHFELRFPSESAPGSITLEVR